MSIVKVSEELYNLFCQLEQDWKDKGLYDYITEEEKKIVEADFNSIHRFEELETEANQIKGGLDITARCKQLADLAVNRNQLRCIVDIAIAHAQHLRDNHPQLVPQLRECLQQTLPEMRERWKVMEETLKKRKEDADLKRNTISEEEMLLLAYTLDEQYLMSAAADLQQYQPSDADKAASNYSSLDFFKRMTWDCKLASIKTEALQAMIQLQAEIEEDKARIMGGTRPLGELLPFQSEAAFQQKYGQMTRRHAIDTLSQRPRNFVTEKTVPILPTQTQTLVADPTEEECKILSHILDSETIADLLSRYSKASPSDQLKNSTRLIEMSTTAQTKWMEDWTVRRDALLSDLALLNDSLRKNFVDEETYQDYKKKLSHFSSNTVFLSKKSALSRSSEISNLQTALEDLINKESAVPPTSSPVPHLSCSDPLSSSDYEALSCLLHLQTLDRYSDIVGKITFKDAVLSNMKYSSLSKQEKREALMVWNKKYSQTLDDLLSIKSQLETKLLDKCITIQERQLLLQKKDDATFLIFHAGENSTLKLKSIEESLQELKYLSRSDNNSEGDNSKACDNEPASDTKQNKSEFSDESRPSLTQGDYEGLLCLILKNKLDDLLPILRELEIKTVVPASDVSEEQMSSDAESKKRQLMQEITEMSDILCDHLHSIRPPGHYEMLLVHSEDKDFLQYKLGNVLSCIDIYYKNCIRFLNRMTHREADQNYQKFVDILVGLHCMPKVEDYQRIMENCTPSEEVKNKYNFSRMNKQQRDEFLWQWNAAFVVLNRNLDSLLNSISLLTKEVVNKTFYYFIVRKGVSNDFFHKICSDHTFTKTLRQVGDWIDEFITNFDDFLPATGLCYLTYLMDLDLASNYAFKISKVTPTEECKVKADFYRMSPEDQDRWIVGFKYHIQEELVELSTITKALETSLQNYDFDSGERERLEKKKSLTTVVQYHRQNSKLPQMEKLLNSVVEKSKSFVCPDLLPTDIITLEDTKLLSAIIDLEEAEALRKEVSDMTLEADINYCPTTTDIKKFEDSKKFFIRLQDSKIRTCRERVDALCAGKNLTVEKKRLDKFRTSVELETYQLYSPHTDLTKRFREETRQNFKGVMLDIRTGLCKNCTMKHIHSNDLKLLHFLYDEIVNLNPSLNEKSVETDQNSIAGNIQECRKEIQTELSKLTTLKSRIQTMLLDLSASVSPCPGHDNLHKHQRFLKMYIGHSQLSRVAEIYHKAKEIKHKFKGLSYDVNKTLTAKDLLLLKFFVEHEVLGEVKEKLITQDAPSPAFLDSFKCSQHSKDIIRTCWKLNREKRLNDIAQRHQTCLDILEMQLFPDFPVQGYKDWLLSQKQSSDFLQYWQEDAINAQILVESIIHPTLDELAAYNSHLRAISPQTDGQSESTTLSSGSYSTPSNFYPSISSPIPNDDVRLPGITPLKASSPGLSTFDVEVLSHYFNYINCQQAIQNYSVEKNFRDSLRRLNLQDMQESDSEFLWLKERNASHSINCLNKLRRVRAYLKPTYELVVMGRGANLMIGEKDWKQKIDAFLSNTDAKQQYENDPLTREINEIIANQYVHFSKKDYEVVFGSLQYEEIECLSHTSHLSNQKISHLRAALEQTHIEYNNRKCDLREIRKQPGFYDCYNKDANTILIREHAQSMNVNCKTKEEEKYYEDQKKSTYLECIIAYMLDNFKRRFDSDTEQPDIEYIEESKKGVSSAKELYKLRRSYRDHRLSISSVLGDIMCLYSISSLQNHQIINSKSDIHNMAEMWRSLCEMFKCHKWNPYNRLLTIYRLNGEVMFESVNAMISSVIIVDPVLPKTFHEALTTEDQETIVKAHNFMILQKIRVQYNLTGQDDLTLVDLMIPLEEAYYRVHEDDRLGKLAESFFSLAYSGNRATRLAHFDTVSPPIKTVMEKYNVNLRELELHLRASTQPSSLEQRTLEQIVALDTYEELTSLHKKMSNKPSKYAKVESGYYRKNQSEKIAWKGKWLANRDELYQKALSQCEGMITYWETDHQTAYKDRLRTTNAAVISTLKYHPSKKDFINFLRFAANSREEECALERKILLSQRTFYFYVPPAIGSAHYEITQSALPFTDFQHLKFLPVEKDLLVLFDNDMIKFYKECSNTLHESWVLGGKDHPMADEVLPKLKQCEEMVKKCTQKDSVRRYLSKEMNPRELKVALDAKSFQVASLFLQECEKIIHKRLTTTAGFWTLTDSDLKKENSDIELEIQKLKDIMRECEISWLSVTDNRFVKERYARSLIARETSHPHYIDALVPKPKLNLPPKEPVYSSYTRLHNVRYLSTI